MADALSQMEKVIRKEEERGGVSREKGKVLIRPANRFKGFFSRK